MTGAAPPGPRRWGVNRLVGAWVAYWILLLAVSLRGMVMAFWRMRQSGGHGSASVGIDDGRLEATVRDGSHVLWHGAVDFTTLALWLAVPPLVLLVLWLVLQPRGAADGVAGANLRGPAWPRELRDGQRVPTPRPRDRVAEPRTGEGPAHR